MYVVEVWHLVEQVGLQIRRCTIAIGLENGK